MFVGVAVGIAVVLLSAIAGAIGYYCCCMPFLAAAVRRSKREKGQFGKAPYDESDESDDEEYEEDDEPV